MRLGLARVSPSSLSESAARVYQVREASSRLHKESHCSASLNENGTAQLRPTCSVGASCDQRLGMHVWPDSFVKVSI